MCSPFKRCVQTGTAIAQALGVPLSINLQLCEFLKNSWYDYENPIPGLEAIKKREIPVLEYFGVPKFPENLSAAADRYKNAFSAVRAAHID
jgi:broad specificity phosphatase PhoE